MSRLSFYVLAWFLCAVYPLDMYGQDGKSEAEIIYALLAVFVAVFAIMFTIFRGMIRDAREQMAATREELREVTDSRLADYGNQTEEALHRHRTDLENLLERQTGFVAADVDSLRSQLDRKIEDSRSEAVGSWKQLRDLC